MLNNRVFQSRFLLKTDTLLAAVFKKKSPSGRKKNKLSWDFTQTIQCSTTVHEHCIGGEGFFVKHVHKNKYRNRLSVLVQTNGSTYRWIQIPKNQVWPNNFEDRVQVKLL